MRQLRVGDTVLVPWGIQRDVKGKVVEVWGDPDEHIRVELAFEDDDDDAPPTTLLLSAAVVRVA